MLVFMGVVIHLKDELLIAHGWNPEKIKDKGKIPTWGDSSTEEKSIGKDLQVNGKYQNLKGNIG